LDFQRGRFVKVVCSRNSVGGPIQMFRRQCYETIGGYQRLSCGGIDAVAETMARMHGWQVESFPDITVYHHRATGTAGGWVIRARFKKGEQHYLIGYHPLFHMASSMFRFSSFPFMLGSLAEIAGYTWAFLRNQKKVVPDGFVRFLREEQWARLRSLLLTQQDPALHSQKAGVSHAK
jgi:poly-beta-1,6-N-acetyl-D-glucosamine synthase